MSCSTPVFRPWSTPNSANATQTCRKIRTERPGLRQMPDQMSGRNFMRWQVPDTSHTRQLDHSTSIGNGCSMLTPPRRASILLRFPFFFVSARSAESLQVGKMESVDVPDFSNGVAVDRVPDGGMMEGSAGGEAVILARRGGEFFAVGASCSHYGGPLAKGLIVSDELRCPLHHACFSLRTGEALRAPAFDAIPCWRVERRGDRVFVREKLASPKP